MDPSSSSTRYAGFWWRVLASMLDSLIMFLPIGMLYFIAGVAFLIVKKGAGIPFSLTDFMKTHAGLMQASMFVVNQIIVWLYYALFESSAWRATPGKRICSLVVTDMEGRRLSFLQATGRYFAKFISGMTLMVGYMMAGWTKRKQALHDMIAETLVLRHAIPDFVPPPQLV